MFDGTYSPHRRRRFGAPAGDRDPRQFVVFTQNHDHVGNRALGDRLPREVQPLAAFAVLLSTFTPMLFQGEEYGEPAPFQFFSDHIDEEIATATRDGRLREFAQFEAFAGPGARPAGPRDVRALQADAASATPSCATSTGGCIAARRELGPAEADAERVDEDAARLTVRRGDARAGDELRARASARVPVAGDRVVLSTHDVRLEDGHAILPPLAGALVR